MKASRVQRLPNPIILQEIVYNHREEQNDTSSQASFLKLSEKHSQQLQRLQQSSIFQDMQSRLNELQNYHRNQLIEVANEIKRYEESHSKETLDLGNVLMQQNTKNTTYRKLQGDKYGEEDYQQCNFEMDENLNYVKDGLSLQGSRNVARSSNVKQVMLQTFGIGREMKQSFASQPKSQSIPKLMLIQSEYNPKGLLESRLTDECRQANTTSRAKRKTTISTCKQQTKRGRVYEQILSLYSTAKLLAMQKQHN